MAAPSCQAGEVEEAVTLSSEVTNLPRFLSLRSRAGDGVDLSTRKPVSAVLSGPRAYARGYTLCSTL